MNRRAWIRGRALSQPPLVLRNQGKGTFEDTTKTLGAAFNRPIMGRGAAHADFDGDGDLDIVLATLAGPAYLFRNDGGNQHNWLRVRVTGSRSNRSGLGTAVRVTSASGVQTQVVRSGSSYASQSELDADVRPRPGHERVSGRGAVAVGQGADVHRPRRRTEWSSSMRSGGSGLRRIEND